jgi:hypothetical protein
MVIKSFREAEHDRVEEVIDCFRASPDLGWYNYLELFSSLFDFYREFWPNPYGQVNDKSRWDIWSSSAKQLTTGMIESKLYKMVLPLFGLQEVGETLLAYDVLLQEYVKNSKKIKPHIEKYDNYLLEASKNLLTPSKSLIELYASVKTWQKDEDFDEFMDSWPDYVSSKVEIIVEGPIKLFLQLSRDAFLLLLKIPTVKDKESAQRTRDLETFMTDFYDAVHDAEFFDNFCHYSRAIIDTYITSFRELFPDNRKILPTTEARKNFINFVNKGG